MIITDTHTHLYSEAFDDDRTEVIEACIEQGYTVFYSSDRFYVYRGNVCTRKQLPENMFLMMGVHPTHVKDNYLGRAFTCKRQLEAENLLLSAKLELICIWDKRL